MRKLAFAIGIVLLVMLTGCSNQSLEPEGLITHIPELTHEEKQEDTELINNNGFEAYFPDASNSLIMTERLPYHRFSHMISRMEVGKDMSLHVLDIESTGEVMYRFFGAKGEFSKLLEDNYGFMYYCKERESFFVYNISDERIDELDSELVYKQTVLDNFSPYEIKEMVFKKDNLYILYVQENPYNNKGNIAINNYGYADYGETIIKVSVDDRTNKTISIQGLITMCDSENDYIYLYAFRGETYVIEVYDPSIDKIRCYVEVRDAGYVFSFAIIGKIMYYYSDEASGLFSINLENKENKVVITGYRALLQSDLDFIGKYLVCYDRNRWEIYVIDTVTGDISSDKGAKRKTNDECDVVIGAISLPFDPANISDITDLTIGGYESPIDENFSQQLMFKLMAGDDDIDIYMFYLSDPAIRKLTTAGVCFDLSVSERLTEENNRLFDNISNYFKTNSGAIWGVPLSSYIPVIVSYEDNLRKAGILSTDLKDFSSMMDCLEKLNDLEGIYVYGNDYGYWLLANYITNNMKTDFSSDVFKDYFMRMWSGWDFGEEDGFENHPLLGKAKLVRVEEDGRIYYLAASEYSCMVDPDKTLFHMVGVNDIMTRESLKEGTTVSPLPLISGGYKQSITIPLIAIVNPNGKNRDKAIHFLEDYSEYIRKNGNAGMIYKDISDYPDFYSTDSKIFNDVYDICKDALVMDHGMANDYYFNEITDYQSGKIDIDTALRSMQRKEDAYRNE